MAFLLRAGNYRRVAILSVLQAFRTPSCSRRRRAYFIEACFDLGSLCTGHDRDFLNGTAGLPAEETKTESFDCSGIGANENESRKKVKWDSGLLL